MSSGGYPSSLSERKQYTEEDQKLLEWIRQYRSQPVTHDQYSTNPVDEREMNVNAPEIVHIPLKYQQFKSSLDLPQAAAAVIRHSSSTTRTLVQSVMGQNYIELHAQNSTDKNPINRPTN